MHSRQSGFSLLEVLTVLMAGLLISGLALMGFKEGVATLSATSAEEIIAGKLRQAREMAIAQRKCVKVSFTESNVLQIHVQNTLSSATLVEEVPLPAGITYSDPISGYTPDGMSGLYDVRGCWLVFFGDGSARAEASSTGPRNNVIHISRSDRSSHTASSAVTVLGSTGRVHAYHFDASRGGWY